MSGVLWSWIRCWCRECLQVLRFGLWESEYIYMCWYFFLGVGSRGVVGMGIHRGWGGAYMEDIYVVFIWT